jgi:hypothetical protein
VSSFTAPLILEVLPKELEGLGMFAVSQPFSYDVGYEGSGDTITVPARFPTDLCTIPMFARPFIPTAGRMAKPALLHDWLLACGDSRCHDIFDEALGVAKVSQPLRWIMVKAVRFHWWFKGIRSGLWA